MYMGKCVERAPANELFKKPMHPYTCALLAAIPTIKLGQQISHNLIKGEVTSPINPKPGCRFSNRCEKYTEECSKRDFKLVEAEPEHFVACRLYE